MKKTEYTVRYANLFIYMSSTIKPGMKTNMSFIIDNKTKGIKKFLTKREAMAFFRMACKTYNHVIIEYSNVKDGYVYIESKRIDPIKIKFVSDDELED